jgi:ribokinase
LKALTIGSAMLDTIAVIADDRIEQVRMSNADTSFLLLEEGRKTDALEISIHSGGGAVNTAVAMARLGHRAATLVKLGRDQRAETIIAGLLDDGVDVRWIRRADDLPTGASVLISSHDRNAAIFTYRGANTSLVPEDLERAAFDVDLVYIASLSNRSADCFPALVALAREAGGMVATNPGIRQLSARSGTVLEGLASIDLLVMNRVEAEAMIAPVVARHGEIWAGRDAPQPYRELPEQVRRPLSGGGYQVGVLTFLSTLVSLGAARVALTLGRHGALLRTGEALYFCPALEHPNPAGSAGAGDAFASTLAAFLAAGAPPETALRAAAINAASVVSHVDAQSGLLRAEELARRLDAEGGRLAVLRWPDAPSIQDTARSNEG